MTTAFGAIDLGSNSVRCLGVVHENRRLKYLLSGRWNSRLSEGINDETKKFSPQALKRTLQALLEAAKMLEERGILPRRTRFFATESLRSAEGVKDVIPMMEKTVGLPLQVVSGKEEARLSLEGALLGVTGADTVFDLGGGSLELACEGFERSFRLGAVRMASIYGDDASSILKHARTILCDLHGRPGKLAGVGGTSSSVAMMVREIPWRDYHPARVHRCKIRKSELGRLRRNLSAMDLSARQRVTGLEPSRADIIVPGICVIEVLLDCLDLEAYIHGETDILWAVCAAAAAEEGLETEVAVFC